MLMSVGKQSERPSCVAIFKVLLKVVTQPIVTGR